MTTTQRDTPTLAEMRQRRKELLGWPDLPDDPEAEAAYRAANEKAQEEARRFYGIDRRASRGCSTALRCWPCSTRIRT